MSPAVPDALAEGITESVLPLPRQWAAGIDRLLAQSRVPGAAIALITPQGRFVHCYGRRKMSEDGPVQPDTLFNIASMTKAFVATLALSLSQQGKLDLDEPVARLLPELCFEPDWINGEISWRDLLSNRLGLQRGGLADYGLAVGFDPAELIRRFSAMRRSGPFRATFSYCNPAFDAAVLAMERLTGLSIDTLLYDRLLGPAGLAHALARDPAPTARFATGHVFDRTDRLIEAEAAAWTRPGAGGLLSSAADQLRWLALNLGEGSIDGQRVLPRAIWQELWTPHIHVPVGDRELWVGTCESGFAAYGLGWFVTELHGRPMAVHSGGDIGWRSRIALLPDQAIGLSVLTNGSGSVGTAVQHRLLELCLGLAPQPWSGLIAARAARQRAGMLAELETGWGRSPDAAARPTEFVGDYRNPESGILTLTSTDAGMALSFVDGPIWNGVLAPLGGDVFDHAIGSPIATYDGHDAPCPRVRFLRTNGRVAALDHSSMGVFERCASSTFGAGGRK